MFRYLIFLVFVVGAAGVAGVRVHPEAVQDWVKKKDFNNFRKIDMKTGGSFIGELVGETEESIKIQVEGGSFVFQKSELASMRNIDQSEMDFYATELIGQSKRSLVTWRKEDGLFYKPPDVQKPKFSLDPRPLTGATGGGASGAAGQQPGQLPAAGMDMNSLLSQVQQVSSLIQQQNAEMENLKHDTDKQYQ